MFVGRIGYPHVNTGILAPQEYGKTEEMSLPELWYEKNLSIKEILNHRGSLIYSRFKSKIKDARQSKKFLNTMQEISLADKAVSTEIFLKKPFEMKMNIDKHLPVIGNPAPLKSIRLEENPHVKRKVDYIASDTDTKAAVAIKEINQFTNLNIDTTKLIQDAELIEQNLQEIITQTKEQSTEEKEHGTKRLYI